MHNYSVEYLSFREAPLETEHHKQPLIELEVVARSKVVEHFQKLQQDYEKNPDQKTLLR